MFGNAESYERFMGRWSRLLAPLFIDFVNIADEGQLLDIGSGTGALSFEIVRRKAGLRVTGIDLSRDYVAYANSLNPAPDRLTFEVANAHSLRFADNTFHATVSSLVFNFIPDPLKALQAARRVTVSGGRIAAAVWDYGEGMRMLRTFWDAATSLDDRAAKLDEGLMPLCRRGELSNLWKAAGLEKVEEQPLDVELRFDSFDDYWQPFLSGQGPAGAYTASLGATELARLQNELRHRLCPSGKDNVLVMPARTWAVRGVVPA